MITDLFQEALTFTLGQEGGWVDNPADPCGPTMHGITLSVFRMWRHDPSLGAGDLHVIAATEVGTIYRALYWNPIGGERLLAGVGLSVFDAAVNLGVRRAALLLQAAVGAAPDGVVGPMTLAATNREAAGAVVGKLATARAAFYRECDDFETFGAGWLTRNQACLGAARRAANLAGQVSLSQRPSVPQAPQHTGRPVISVSGH